MDPGSWTIARRDFLRVAAGALAGLTTGCYSRWMWMRDPVRHPPVRFGLVTDAHYADANPAGTRFYRESLAKMREAVEHLRAEHVDFLVELGDLKDMAAGEPEAQTQSHLVAIEAELQKFGRPTYHVLGNHDMDNISKSQALGIMSNTGISHDRGYYSFVQAGVHFIVLDACYLRNGRDYDHGNFDWRETCIPPAEIAWLERELAAAKEPVIVLAHQRLDGSGDTDINNSAEVRALLERSGKTLAVFTGHEHAGGYRLINGIHYYTLKGMVEGSGVENNAYAIVEVLPSLDITVTGYRKAVSREMKREAATVQIVAA
jgi:hypothetical protein